MLCTGHEVWGALPPLPVAAPWWPEAWDVVAAAKQTYDLDVTVLRLLEASIPRMPGGIVTYLAEVSQRPETPLTAWPGDPLADHPLRQSWARPGGPRQHVTWAMDRLADAGVARTGAPEQVKTWNLSTLWRLPTERGNVWLKVAPHFFAHEGAIMSRIGPPVTPVLYAAEPGRILMSEVTGDNHETTGPGLAPMVEILTDVQVGWIGREDELLALGLPDRRLVAMRPRIEQVAADHVADLAPRDRGDLLGIVESMDGRIRAIADCGVPESLTHGDFHPGNVQGQVGSYVVIDWGDSCVSHPMTDELAFTRRLGAEDRKRAAAWFSSAWHRLVPGCEPDRAAALLRPMVPLIAAVMYADFVKQIEPDERIYHRYDVAEMLTAAVSAHRSSYRTREV